MKENRGITLVEVVITVAMLSIVLLIATSFMTIGSRTFTKGNADTQVQKEAELAVNQLENMIIDVNSGVQLTEDAVSGDKTLTLYNEVSGGAYTKESIIYRAAEHKILYSKWDAAYDVSTKTYLEGSAIYTNQLLSENVKRFEADTGDVYMDTAKDGSSVEVVKSIRLTVEYEDSSGQVSYAASPIVTLRNRVIKN